MKKLKMEFISSTVLDNKTKNKRINFILNKVKDGSILVVDGVFTAEDEMDLIKETMRRVDDGFPGIEVCSLKKQIKGLQGALEKLIEQRSRFQKILMGKPPETYSLKTGITLIGPAKYIKEIKKNPESFSIFAGV